MKNQFIIIALILAPLSKIDAQDFRTVTSPPNPPNFARLSYNEASDMVNSEEGAVMSSKKDIIGGGYISNLVNQIRYGNLNNEKKVLAIYLLGVLQPSDTNSIEILLDNIDLKATRFDPPVGPARWGEYPAEEALIKIGKPVIDPILNHLPTENSELRRQLMCDVLKRVLR